MATDTKPLVPVKFILGVLTFLAGGLLLGDSLGALQAESGLSMWPLAVIVIGLTVWMQPGTANSSVGISLTLAGFWLLLNEANVWDYSFWDTWPLLLLMFGAWMLYRTDQMRQIAGGADGFDEQTTGAANVAAFAFMGQVERKTTGQKLRTGEMSAVFGECSFDFTDAQPGSKPIVVDAFALVGKVRITVPDDWVVVHRVLPLLGKVTGPADEADDNDATEAASAVAAAAADGDAEPPVDLLVQGTAILGGVEVTTAG